MKNAENIDFSREALELRWDENQERHDGDFEGMSNHGNRIDYTKSVDVTRVQAMAALMASVVLEEDFALQ